MKLKRIAMFLTVISLSLTSLASNAEGVLTFDTTAAANAVKSLTQMKQQYDELKSQYEQMVQQYQAVTGNRNLGQILNDPNLHSYLPDSWEDVYSQANNGSFGTDTVKNAEGLKGNTDAQQRYYDTLMANKAMAETAYDNNVKRLDNIQALMEQANETQDAKAAVDLQNRISTEEATIQNEQARLNMMAKLQQTELRLAEEQRDKEFDTMMINN